MVERSEFSGYALSELDFAKIRSLHDGLKPLEGLIKNLCSEKMDLYTSEKLHKKVLKRLKKQNTEFSTKLHDALKRRYLERRNHGTNGQKIRDVISLITFLRDPVEYDKYYDPDFPLTPEKDLRKLAKQLLERMFHHGEVQVEQELPAPDFSSDSDSDSD